MLISIWSQFLGGLLIKGITYFFAALLVNSVIFGFDREARELTGFLGTQISSNFKVRYYNLLYQRDIRVLGDASADLEFKESIYQLLPHNQSTLWWYANIPQIEARIRRHKLVMDAKLEPCLTEGIGCFELTISRRTPQFLAIAGQIGLVLGDDGAVISTIEPDSQVFLSLSGQLPVLAGFSQSDLSSDRISSSFMQLRRALHIIERESGLRVRALVQDSSDIKVFLATLAYPVIFDAASLSRSTDIDWEAKLVQLTGRIRKLNDEIKQSAMPQQQIKALNLGLPSMAVISLKDIEVAGSAK